MNLLALFAPKPAPTRIVYSRSAKAASDYLAKHQELHARLIDETIEDEDARIEMQRTLFGIPAVRKGLGV